MVISTYIRRTSSRGRERLLRQLRRAGDSKQSSDPRSSRRRCNSMSDGTLLALIRRDCSVIHSYANMDSPGGHTHRLFMRSPEQSKILHLRAMGGASSAVEHEDQEGGDCMRTYQDGKGYDSVEGQEDLCGESMLEKRRQRWDFRFLYSLCLVVLLSLLDIGFRGGRFPTDRPMRAYPCACPLFQHTNCAMLSHVVRLSSNFIIKIHTETTFLKR